MRNFLDTLSLVVMIAMITSCLLSMVAIYFRIKEIEKDPIYQEALTIVTERKYNEQKN